MLELQKNHKVTGCLSFYCMYACPLGCNNVVFKKKILYFKVTGCLSIYLYVCIIRFNAIWTKRAQNLNPQGKKSLAKKTSWNFNFLNDASRGNNPLHHLPSLLAAAPLVSRDSIIERIWKGRKIT